VALRIRSHKVQREFPLWEMSLGNKRHSEVLAVEVESWLWVFDSQHRLLEAKSVCLVREPCESLTNHS